MFENLNSKEKLDNQHSNEVKELKELVNNPENRKKIEQAFIENIKEWNLTAETFFDEQIDKEMERVKKEWNKEKISLWEKIKRFFKHWENFGSEYMEEDNYTQAEKEAFYWYKNDDDKKVDVAEENYKEKILAWDIS